uniref:Uncharacterized protein n=1 Tax=Ciona savignyi TaxID=51511 RepID=H2YZ84_CIOSA
MNPDMVKARHILERIQKREIYKFVDEVRPGKKPMSQSCLKIQSEIGSLSDSLNKEDISVNILKYDYGMNTKNPCDKFMFYSKNQPTKPYYIRKEEVSVMLPNSFQDCVIQMFCKDQDKLELAKDCFDKWCANNDYKMKSVSHNAVLTPLKRKSIGQGRSAKNPKKLSKF